MSKRTTKFYRKNEVDIMRRLGFKPTINSGAGWIQKEDGENDFCICQLKSTDKQSINIKQEDLHMLEYHAAVSHKTPVFAVQFLNTDETWLMIKPGDIEQIKGIISGEKTVDNSEGQEYNKDTLQETENQYNVVVYKNYEDSPENVKKSLIARQAYLKQREQEKQNKEKQMKERQKQKRKEQREWQKSNSNKKG